MKQIYETNPIKIAENFLNKLKSDDNLDEEDPYYSDLCEYNNIVEGFGKTIIYKIHESYSGDMWYLLDINDKLAYLNLSYGSCSGCDALMGCQSLKDLNDLIIEIYNSMVKFNTLMEAKQYFESESRKFDAAWYYDENREFVQDSLKYINTRIQSEL